MSLYNGESDTGTAVVLRNSGLHVTQLTDRTQVARLYKEIERQKRERERERERQDKTRQDYFIVRPPAHYNRSEHSGNSTSHG